MKVTHRTWIANPGGNGGAWQYHDEKEALFVFEMLMMTGIDISSIDSFIEGKEAPLPDWIVQHLAERRAEALQSYLAGDIEQARSQVDALRNACLIYGQNLGAAPDVRKGRAVTENARNASRHPRGTKIIDDDWVFDEYTRLVASSKDDPEQLFSKVCHQINVKYQARGPSKSTVYRAIAALKKRITSAASDGKN